MLTVSNYHYIKKDFKTKYPSIFGLTPMELKKQLLLLRNQGEFINSTDLLNNTNEILKSSDNFIYITFDDGLKEQYNFGLSILDELDIPAIFFVNSKVYLQKKVTTVHKIHLLRSILSSNYFLEYFSKLEVEFLNSNEKIIAKNTYVYDDKESAELKYLLNFKLKFDYQEEIIDVLFSKFYDEDKVIEELYMSIENILRLANLKYLGSHTHSHYPLSLLNDKDIIEELKVSKNFFEKITETPINIVSYPYGTIETCKEPVATFAKKIGYKIGFTTNRGINKINKNKLLLNRFDCNDLIGGKNFKK